MRRRKKTRKGAKGATIRWTPDVAEVLTRAADELGLSANATANLLTRLAGSLVLNQHAELQGCFDRVRDLKQKRRADRAADEARKKALAEPKEAMPALDRLAALRRVRRRGAAVRKGIKQALDAAAGVEAT